MDPNIATDLPVLPYIIHLPGQRERSHVFAFYDPANPGDSALDLGSEPRAYGLCETTETVASLSMLASLGFTNTVTVGMRANSKLHLFLHETLFQTKVENRLYTTGDSAIMSVTLGLGFRLAITCWDIQADAKLTTVTGIAASTQVKTLGSQFDAQLLGADADALKVFVPVLNRAGNGFGFDELHAMERASKELIQYFGDRGRWGKLVPSLLRVDVDIDRIGSKNGMYPFKQVLAAEMYAMFMVRGRNSPNQALAHPNNNVNHWPKAYITPETVREAYLAHYGLQGDEKPNDGQANQAYDFSKTVRY